MAFFEELGKTITDKSKEAAKKAKEITGVIQLKSQLTGEKARLNEVYTRLGRIFYDEHQDEYEGRFEEDFAEVRSVLAKISQLEEEIGKLEGSRVCAECGSKVGREARFCSYCGAPLQEVEEAGEEEKKEEVKTEEKEEAGEKEPEADAGESEG